MNDEIKPEVCEAVTLILKRMDSNPEEFVDLSQAPHAYDTSDNRWIQVINKFWSYLNQHEQDLLKDKKRQLLKTYHREEFRKAVMKELLVGKEDPAEFRPMVYK